MQTRQKWEFDGEKFTKVLDSRFVEHIVGAKNGVGKASRVLQKKDIVS